MEAKRRGLEYKSGMAMRDKSVNVPTGTVVNDTKRASAPHCRCGSSDHSRTTSKKCPLNKKLADKKELTVSESVVTTDNIIANNNEEGTGKC